MSAWDHDMQPIRRIRGKTLLRVMTVFDNSTGHKSLKGWTPRRFLGWLAVALSTSIASLWAFWGIIENFHEGWFHESLLLNVGLMFVQYLSPVMIFVSLSGCDSPTDERSFPISVKISPSSTTPFDWIVLRTAAIAMRL